VDKTAAAAQAKCILLHAIHVNCSS